MSELARRFNRYLIDNYAVRNPQDVETARRGNPWDPTPVSRMYDEATLTAQMYQQAWNRMVAEMQPEIAKIQPIILECVARHGMDWVIQSYGT